MHLKSFFSRYGVWWLGLLLFSIIYLFLGVIYYKFWGHELGYDFSVYHDRALFFLRSFSWPNIGYNEYPTGALWFFIFLASVTRNYAVLANFISTAVIINLLIAIAHIVFFLRTVGHKSAFFCAVCLLAFGPILLFRFELLVSFLLLLAWHFFSIKNNTLAGFLLGLAVSIKFYPIVLLPLWLAGLLSDRKNNNPLFPVLLFLLGVSLAPLLYVAFGGNLHGVYSAVAINGLKPIGLDSLYGNFIIIWRKTHGLTVDFEEVYGIYGFDSIPFKIFFNNFWILPTLFFLLFFIAKRKFCEYSEPILAFIFLLFLTVFSKSLNPQYLWWSMSFLPFILARNNNNTVWGKLFGFICLVSLVLTQLVYPIFFADFLGWLRGINLSPNVFYFLVVRNLFLLAVLGFTIWKIFQRFPSQAHEY